jgi:hypothetical protein
MMNLGNANAFHFLVFGRSPDFGFGLALNPNGVAASLPPSAPNARLPDEPPSGVPAPNVNAPALPLDVLLAAANGFVAGTAAIAAPSAPLPVLLAGVAPN